VLRRRCPPACGRRERRLLLDPDGAPAYHANIYDASQTTRTYAGIVSGTWGRYNLSGAYQVTELFYNENASTKTGGTPRISFSQSQRQIGGRRSSTT